MLEEEAPRCLKPDASNVDTAKVLHHIITHPAPPVHMKRRDLAPDKRALVEQEFMELEATGIIRRSSSPWASALHVVTKKDGTIRPCGDYRALNNLTIPDSYPMPLVTDIMNRLQGSTIFSKVDLKKAYHQIHVAKRDIEKTAITTPFGLFEYLKMPFGLRNAAQTFQRHMDQVLQGLPFAFPYMDDILIASTEPESHLTHIRTVLHRLHHHNLQIKMEKSEFGKESVHFLGFDITTRGVHPIPERIDHIRSIQPPSNVTALRSFLGMVNFYHRFIANCSALLAPLTGLATGPKKARVNWSDETSVAFEQAKQALSRIPSLHFPNQRLPLQLICDASDIAIGAVLHQINNGVKEPLEFFSRKLNGPQSRYSAFDRELLAIVESIKHFQHFLEGRNFIVFTDHKPLLHALSMKSPTPRQHRQISFLSEFHLTIEHVAGKENIVADYLSRSIVSAINFRDAITEAEFQDAPPPVDVLKPYEGKISVRNGVYLDESMTGCPRIILHERLRKRAFLSIHNLHHPGRRSTYELLHTRVTWPHMRKDVGRWCQECVECQKNKITRHTKPPLQHFPTGARFEVLHIDLVGPLTPSNGYTHLLTMIDRKTRWPEVVPVRNITAETIAKKVVEIWFARYGIPSTIITDQGTQFESSLFKTLSTKFGFKHCHTTAYHPQTNGMIERFHRSLKTSLRCLSVTSNWVDCLPMVLLGWRNTFHTATGTSPSTLLFGCGTALPEELNRGDPDIPLQTLDATRKHFLDFDTNPSFGRNHQHTAYVPSSLRVAKFVWMQARDTHHMKPRYTGPYRVKEMGHNTAKIEINGKITTVNIEKLKTAHGFSDVEHPARDEMEPHTTISCRAEPTSAQCPGDKYPTKQPPTIFDTTVKDYSPTRPHHGDNIKNSDTDTPSPKRSNTSDEMITIPTLRTILRTSTPIPHTPIKKSVKFTEWNDEFHISGRPYRCLRKMNDQRIRK